MPVSVSYLIGLLFIFLVAVIWAASSVLVQHVYNDLDFESPFTVTYICNSLFIVLLPSRLLWEKIQIMLKNTFKANIDVVIIPFKSGPVLDDTNHDEDCETESMLLVDHLSLKNTCESEHSEDSDSCDNNVPTQCKDLRDVPEKDETFILGHYETFLISARLAPVWFIANYLYNLSLNYTSVTSSTVLASTSSLFTYIIALLCKEEQFTFVRLSGVLLCIFGSILTCFGDSTDQDSKNEKWLLGEAFGLFAAIGYGSYTVIIRVLCPADENKVSMQLLFGYVGLLNLIFGAPVMIMIFIRTQGVGLSKLIFLWLVTKGLFDNVLSDYLWARAIVLTSATVATTGLGLTIPLAFLSDAVIHETTPTIHSGISGLSVLIGFILVNIQSTVEQDVSERIEEESENLCRP